MFVWFLLQCLLSVIPFYRDRAGTTLVSYINLWDKIRQKNNASFFRPNAAATSVTRKLYCQSKKWYTFSILIKIWILSYSICLSCNKNFKVSQADKLKIFLCLTCMLPVIQYLSKASDLKLIIKRNEESWLGLADLVSPQRWGDRDFSESVHKDPLLHVLPQVEGHRGGFHQVIDLLIVNLQEGTLQEELWTLEYMEEGNTWNNAMFSKCFTNYCKPAFILNDFISTTKVPMILFLAATLFCDWCFFHTVKKFFINQDNQGLICAKLTLQQWDSRKSHQIYSNSNECSFTISTVCYTHVCKILIWQQQL